MTTSGTAVFTVTRDQIINAALRSLKVISAGQSGSTDDITDCAFALGLILNTMNTDGYMTWLYQTISVPFVASQASYTIAESSADVTAFRPVRIAHAFRRDSSTPPNDVDMAQLSRQEYDMLTPKTLEGVPTQFFYDPQLTAGVLYVWPVPEDTTYSARLSIQRPVQDITASTQNFDVLREWYQPLRWMLADEIGLEYEVDLATLDRVEKKATYWRNRLADFSQEGGSVYFQPDPSAR
jgi:hypothetical protein